MLEIIVRIVVAGCLMVGSAHCPLSRLQAGSAVPGAAVAGPSVGPGL